MISSTRRSNPMSPGYATGQKQVQSFIQVPGKRVKKVHSIKNTSTFMDEKTSSIFDDSSRNLIKGKT